MYQTGSTSHIYQDGCLYEGESLAYDRSTSKASSQRDGEGSSSPGSSGSQPVLSEHVRRKIEQRRQNLTELSMLKQIERAENLDRQTKNLPKSGPLDWLVDTDLNMMVYELEDLEWRVFEVVYIIKPDYKDYSLLIPETDRPVLDSSYKLLRRLAKMDGYAQLKVRPITDLPRPCYLPRPIEGHLWQNPAPQPNCAGSLKQSRLPLPSVKGGAVRGSHIPPEIHNLIRRLHKAYAKLCTMVDQWFSPGTVKEYVMRATDKETITHSLTSVPQAPVMETTTQTSTQATCTQPGPRRIRVALTSPRPRLIHNNRYNKVASSGYGRSKKKGKTATEDPKKPAKKILPKSESLDWVQDMDLNKLAYEMEDLEWRVFEVIYVIKPDYKDYSMLIPETDRPVLADGYNLLKRLAKIDGYSQLNVRPITDLPRPCYLPRPIQGHVGPSQVPKPSSGSFKQSRLPLPYKYEESNVLQSHISPEIHNLIRRVHKAYGRLCTMVDQWFSPGTVMENFIQAPVREIPNHQTAKEGVSHATEKDIVTQATNEEILTQATAKDSTSQQAAKEICPRPTPRRIRAPLPSPRPRLIHNNRYNKVASSGYGRCKPQPKPSFTTQTSSTYEYTRNNVAPCPRGQKHQTLAKDDPPPQPKVDIRTAARLNGSRLPIPVKLSTSSLPNTSFRPAEATTASKDTSSTTTAGSITASTAPNTDIRTLARLNGSKLPLPIKPVQSTSQLESKKLSTSSTLTHVVRHPTQMANLPQKCNRRANLRSNLYSDIPSTGYGKSIPRLKTQIFATRSCSSFTVNDQRSVQPKSETRPRNQKSMKPPKPDIRVIARQNGSKIPVPIKLLQKGSQQQLIAGPGHSTNFTTADASDDICSANTSDIKIAAEQKGSKPPGILKPDQSADTVKSTTSQSNSPVSTNADSSKDENLVINPGKITTALNPHPTKDPGSEHQPPPADITGNTTKRHSQPQASAARQTPLSCKSVASLESKANIHSIIIAKQNGSELPIRSPVAIKTESNHLTFSASSKNCVAPRLDIRDAAKQNGSKLPIKSPVAIKTESNPLTSSASSKNCVAPRLDIRDAAKQNGSKLPVPRMLSTTSRDDSLASKCVATSTDDNPSFKPDIRAIARRNGSKLPVVRETAKKNSEPDGRVHQITDTACSAYASSTLGPDNVTTASVKGPNHPVLRKQPMANQSATKNSYPGKNGPSAPTSGPDAVPPMRTTSLREFVDMFRSRPPEKTMFKLNKAHKVIPVPPLQSQPKSKPLVQLGTPAQPNSAAKPRAPAPPKSASKPQRVVPPKLPDRTHSPVQPEQPAQSTSVLPKQPMQTKMLAQSSSTVQSESPVQPGPTVQPRPESPVEPRSTPQTKPESSVQPKPTDQPRPDPPIEPKPTPQPKPESDVQRGSLVQPKPTGQPKPPTETKPQIQLKSPKQPTSPTQLSLCPRPRSTPLPESGRRRIRVLTPSSDPDKPCPVKPARGILKTVCERMDFREMDAMFEATNHPDDYPPFCPNLDRFFYGLMAPRRLVPMGLESWTVLNRRKVQFDSQLNDQSDNEPRGIYERDLEDEEFLELERQCNAEFENEDDVHRES